MACGVAANYSQLVVARMTVGVGEAGGVPPSYAVISDYFPPGRRGTALGIYNLGPPIGAALGVAFGASIAATYSWRDAFIVLGSVGLFAALLVVVVVREPKRGGLDRAPDAGTAASSFGQTIGMFFSKPSLVLAALGSGATQIVTYGSGNFATLFLMREKGMTLGQVAVYYALVIGIGMSAGIFVSGRVIDRFTRRSKQAYALIPAASLALAIPFFLGFVWSPSWPLALVFLTGPNFLNYFYLSSSVTLVQEEVRPDQRVMSGALLLLVMNLIGMGLGPTYVGAASDFFSREPSAPLAADRLLHACPVLCAGDRAIPVAGARAATGSLERRSTALMVLFRRLILCVAMWLAASAPAFAEDAPVVDAPAGVLKGQAEGALNVFKDVPYAVPPVGALRWKPPGALPRWQGVREATAYGPACVQPQSALSSIYASDPVPMSEDCLTLNIWAPANARNAPVVLLDLWRRAVGRGEPRFDL